jgi:probable F420-dependent oxidoreductase
MKFAVVLPVDKVTPEGEYLGPEALTEMGRAADKSAFQACAVTDHPAPTGRWLDAGGHVAQDPFVMLSYLAAATKRIQLLTAILVVPYRNPFITARAIASLQAVSADRLILGVGAGYLKGEYFAVGADFENRNDITDEYLAALKTAWASDEFDFQGTGYNARGIRILPRPRRAPPVWVGGNSRRAIRRAVEYGDAWSPFHNTELVASTARTALMTGDTELAEGLDYLRAHANKIGKAPPRDIVLDGMQRPTPEWNAQALIDQIGRLSAMGLTWANVHIEGRNRAEWLEDLERYSSEVVVKVG